jgi:hypothetical protein
VRVASGEAHHSMVTGDVSNCIVRATVGQRPTRPAIPSVLAAS